MTVSARETFEAELSAATDADAAFVALHRLADALVGVRLFTVMTADAQAGVVRRAYTSHPRAYPATGTKPLERNDWYRLVGEERQCFVANTIKEIADAFPDHELIASLGCASVVNLPVIIRGDFAGSVNLLHETGHFTPERVEILRKDLNLPALAAFLTVS